MNYYPPEIEAEMVKYYKSLNERDKRRYAALEAKKLGYGSRSYLKGLLGCDFKTIAHGERELKNEANELDCSSIRQKGGGRKSKLESIPNIDTVFLDIVKDHTAGDPMNDQTKWTHLSQPRIVQLMKEKGIIISVNIVKMLLDKHGFKKRKAQKKITTGACENRNEQFENISKLKQEYSNSNNPIISIDTKKRIYR